MSNQSELRSTLKSSIEVVLAEVANDTQLRNGMTQSGYQPPAAAPATATSLAVPIAAASPKAAPFKPSDMHSLGSSSTMEAFLVNRLNTQQRLLQQTRVALLQEQLRQHLQQMAQQNHLLQQQLLLKQEGLADSSNQVALARLLASQIQIQQQAANVLVAAARPPITTPASGSQALQALGSHLRKKDDPYIDAARIANMASDDGAASRKTRGGVSEPFPEKLHRMLADMEKDGLTDVVSFLPHGRAFMVHKMDRFVADVMPKYFNQSKWNSFARQLNLYGFIRITSGPDEGGYYHELFLKGRPNLVYHMRRVGVPQGEDRRKMKVKNNRIDPDFYSMSALS